MPDNSGSLTLLMNIIGPLLLGLGILYVLVWTRRGNRNQRARTEAATEMLYEREETARQRMEEPKAQPERTKEKL